MIKLVKKDITKYYSFGLSGVNDEWSLEDIWDGFSKYKNRDNLIIVTYKSPIDGIIDSMLSDIFIGDESFAVGSPDAIKAINDLKAD